MRTHQLLSVFNSLHISLRLSVHSPYGHCDVWSVAKLLALCDTQGGLFHRSLRLCHTQSTFSLLSRVRSPPHSETPLLLCLHGGGNQKVSWLRAGIRQIHLRGDHNGQGQDHSYSNLSRSYSPSVTTPQANGNFTKITKDAILSSIILAFFFQLIYINSHESAQSSGEESSANPRWKTVNAYCSTAQELNITSTSAISRSPVCVKSDKRESNIE